MPFPFSHLRKWALKRSKHCPTHLEPLPCLYCRPRSPIQILTLRYPSPVNSAEPTINFTPRARGAVPTELWLRDATDEDVADLLRMEQERAERMLAVGPQSEGTRATQAWLREGTEAAAMGVREA